MKRCPACKRVEHDDTLTFCRADGTALISDSGSISGDAGTVKLGSGAVSSEIETSILPHKTDSMMNRATAPTTVLPVERTGTTRALANPKRRRTAIAIAVIATAVVAATSAIVVDSYRSRNIRASIESVAVLPFTNTSGNADIEYLSDGITESLINSLSQLPNLSVKARSTVFHYKGKDVTAQQVGSELSVQAVLNGRVTQRGDQLTLNLELVNARTGDQIWGEQYNRKTADLVSLQSEIARDVSNKLRVKLSGADEQKLAKKYTANPEAYQLYLKGRFYWNKRTGEALKKSIEYFNQAIEKDPSYALAYAGLGDAYGLLPGYGGDSPQQCYPKAESAAKRALELDETLAEAHSSLARMLFFYGWNFPESNTEFQRAIELNPNYATAHHWYGNALLATGRFDDAIAEGKRAQELDPLSLIINADVGETYIYARQYDKAIEQLRKTIEMDQGFYYAHYQLGIAYELKGLFLEAVAEYRRAIQLNDDPLVLAYLAHAYAGSGRRDEALKSLDQLKEISKKRYVVAYVFALIYEALGEKDQAFQWLEKAYAEHSSWMPYLKVDPRLDPLRSDPRFAELMRRVGLPQ